MRRALIVATSTYRDPKLRLLRAPSKDASALATVLRAPTIGFFDDVITLRNGRLRVLSQRLEDFCREALLEELLLVHFSCHAIKDDAGALYFATTDTEIDYLDSTAISAEFLRRQLARSRSRRKLLFLDCCYSG